MKKDELKTTVLSILRYIEDSIGSQKEITLHEAIEHLQKADDLFEDINYERNSLEKTIEQLKDRYKDIAIAGIKSYKSSNETFQEIANKQKEQIERISSSSDHIDLELIKSKFADIQEHMVSEVQKANAEIAKLSEKVRLLEEESNVDPLTKVFNRRALKKYLEKICTKKTLKQELHLLMLDIDDFKQINDKYGHVAGDKILIFITHLLGQMLRDGDKIFRYGGEEFVVVLNRIDDEKCRQIAHRILQQISANKLIYKNTTIRVTISIGATKFQPGDTPETLVDRADKALYEAKKNGKNKFVSKQS